MLNRDRERPIVVTAQAGCAVADGVPVDRVGSQVKVGQIVHGDGPERIHRRVLVEGEGVLVAPVELAAVRIGVGHRVGGLVPVVAPQAAAGGQRPRQVASVTVGYLPRRVIDGAEAQVVEVVVEHVEGERPPVDHRRQAACGERRFHLLLRRVRACRQRLSQLGRAVGVGRDRIEQAERREPLLVVLVLARGREGLYPGPQLLEKGQLFWDGRRCRDTLGRRREALPFEGQLALQRADGVEVGWPIAGPAAHDRGHIRRELDHLRPAGRSGFPAWRDEQKGPGRGAGRPATDVGEVVGPRVNELERVVATTRVRHTKQHWAAAHIDLCDGVDGVVVDRHESVVRRGQPGRVAKAVEGSWLDHSHLCLAADHLQVEDQREAVDVGISGERLQLITHSESSLSALRVARPTGTLGRSRGHASTTEHGV